MGQLTGFLIGFIVFTLFFPAVAASLFGLALVITMVMLAWPQATGKVLDYFDRPWLWKYFGDKVVMGILLVGYAWGWGYSSFALPDDTIAPVFVAMMAGPAEEEEETKTYLDEIPWGTPLLTAAERCPDVCTGAAGLFESFSVNKTGKVTCTCNVAGDAVVRELR